MQKPEQSVRHRGAAGRVSSGGSPSEPRLLVQETPPHSTHRITGGLERIRASSLYSKH